MTPTPDFLLRHGFIAGVALAITGLLGWTGFMALSFRDAARDLSAFESVSGEVRRLDEVLTMSAMMGAATADPSWRARYDRHVPLLDHALSQALDLGGPDASAPVQAVANSNKALIDLETRAFELAAAGKVRVALATLHSEEYQAQKAIYARGVERALAVGRAHAHASERGAFASLLMMAATAIAASLAALMFWRRGIVERQAHEVRIALLTKEQELKAAEQANEAKSHFLATMSHELRTPLNAVIGYAEILEEDLSAGGNPQGAADANRIRRAARTLLQLINEVLDFSKIEAGRLDLFVAPCHVDELVGEVLELTKHLAVANGNVVNVSIVDVPELELDAHRLRQCLLNLVSNALKFTTAGEVGIDVRLRGEGPGVILEIEVSDTGVGLSSDQMADLFKPFVQVDGSQTRRQDGTGLGLAITRRLAQLMGGDVTVESVLERGSRFTLQVAARAPKRVSVLVETVASKPLVVMIEDEASAQDLVHRALCRLPFELVSVANGEAGLATCRDASPALVILDVHLPGISGWEVLSRLKADPDLADTPVLILSIDDDRAGAAALGACDHLVKPVDREALTAAVQRFARVNGARDAASGSFICAA